jgi:opacity protein-like surface antigen
MNLRKIIFIVLGLPCSSFAAFSTNNFFFGVEGGYSWSKQFSLKPPSDAPCTPGGACWDNPLQSFASTMGNSPVFGIRGGYTLNKFITGAVTYDTRNSFDDWGRIFPGDPANFPDPRHRFINIIRNQTVMADLIITPNLSWEKIDPFLNAGIGVAYNRVGSLTSINLNTGSINIISGANMTHFAWQVGAGTNINLSENIFLDAGYRLINIGPLQTGNQVIIPTPVLPIPRLKSNDVYLNEVYGGINFRFC